MPRTQAQPAITPGLLLRAYAAGLFPMSDGADDPGLFWVEPEARGIFPLDGIHVSQSLAKIVRNGSFSIRVDQDFEGVIAACAEAAPDRPSTWINGRIRTLYRALFDRGFVHTVEAYAGDRLVGGLYGVALGGAFFGESMFHRAANASKVCLVHLAAELVRGGFSLLDAQFVTPHLQSLGAVEVSRKRYLVQLDQALGVSAVFATDRDLLGGRDALRILTEA